MRHERADAAPQAQEHEMTKPLVESPTLRLMRKYGVPIRRDLFIYLNWMGSPPSTRTGQWNTRPSFPRSYRTSAGSSARGTRGDGGP